MHPIDAIIFILYMLVMLGVGFFFFRRNKGTEDYYVGGRNMSSLHVGLSVVATDVGGGFSIGLGGLGFLIGLSGSWMLFTGLLGAWISAVVLIPRVKQESFAHFTTFPQIFGYLFDRRAALLAGLISGIGYIGFTGSQIRAGATLASSTLDGLTESNALIIMGVIAVIYTVLGGLKAVIYTDTVQWIILMSGLIFIGIPLAYFSVGGWEGMTATLGPEFFTLNNLSWQDLVNWGVTIIPIWFVGMTLYQRIYSCRDVGTAKKAWFYAGFFEWPIMAFMGVSLGLMARVAAAQGGLPDIAPGEVVSMEPEKGLPLLLKTVLPPGLMGLMMSAYLSAILSTADSCLMAGSGNFASDLIAPLFRLDDRNRSFLWISQVLTFVLGAAALVLAMAVTNVLDLMLRSYAFMVSGLLVPLIGGLVFKVRNSLAAIVSMILGGVVTVTLMTLRISPSGEDLTSKKLEFLHEKYPEVMERLQQGDPVPAELARSIQDAQLLRWEFFDLSFRLPWSLDPNIFGIATSLLLFVTLSWTNRKS